jgi:Protein of unknown function (DUF3592)
MGGWFADVIVGYFITLFRVVSRILRARRSKGWPEITATVSGASCQTSSYMPRPVAEIVYTYRLDGGFYGGVDEKPFFFESSAKQYAQRFTRGDSLVVRVKPGKPEVSIVDEGQIRTIQSATSTGISR